MSYKSKHKSPLGRIRDKRMETILKGVFKKANGNFSGRKDKGTTKPLKPPSPDLTHLSAEELAILSKVLKKEENFELEQQERMRQTQIRLEAYESAVRRQACAKEKSKQVDIRLCRLCYKTKFADGIGKVCHDCKRRVCERCGSYSRPHWSQKKQKNVKGRWRCKICQLKRDFICQSGVWFCGKTEGVDCIRRLMDRIDHTSSNYSDSDSISKAESLSSFFSASENYSDVEHTALRKKNSNSMNLSPRAFAYTPGLEERSSASENESDQINAIVGRPRLPSKQKRPPRRNSRQRSRSNPCHFDMDYTDDENYYAPMEDDFHQENTSQNNMNRRSSADFDKFRRISEQRTFCASAHKPVEYKVKNFDGYESKMAFSSKLDRVQKLQKCSYFDDDSSRDSSPARTRTHRLSLPVASVQMNRNSSPVTVRRHSQSPRSDQRNKKQGRYMRNEVRSSKGQGYANVPFLPLPDDKFRNRSASSDSASSRKSSGITELDHSDITEEDELQNFYGSKNPREVLLYRDDSIRYNRSFGLGMRVVGGLRRYNDRLGAYVINVEANGPADSYGIEIGDQILLWNGKSLIDATFEETQEVIQNSPEIAQLLIVHHGKENAPSGEGEAGETINGDRNNQEGIVMEKKRKETNFNDEDSGNQTQAQTQPPNSLSLNKPKRRILPKTPLQMKKEDRKMSGKLHMSLKYSKEKESLWVTLVKSVDLRAPDQHGVLSVNPMALVNLLPNRGQFPPHKTVPLFNTVSPIWNETFSIPDLPSEKVNEKSIEVTIWNKQTTEDLFMGEVLLDLVDANLSDNVCVYDLQDHDENSSPLPNRKRKESSSDVMTTSQISPMASIDTASNWSASPSHLSSYHPMEAKRLSVVSLSDRSRVSSPGTSKVPSEPERKGSLIMLDSAQTSPERRKSGHNLDGSMHRSDSFGSKMRRKVAVAVSKVSSTFHNERRISQYEDKLSVRSVGVDGVSQGLLQPADNKTPRHSTDSKGFTVFDNPVSSRTNSETLCSIQYDSDEENPDHYFSSGDRPAPDGDDITSMLGPAQVAPKPSLEQSVCGDIKMGFMVSKGTLDIDVVCVTGLLKHSENDPPDTYVKTYLVEGLKVIQKKKTPVVKSSYEPTFRWKIKYPACNIHGRCIKMVVWTKQGAFEKKQCLGEAMVKLDRLDLTQHTMAWFKLFPPGSTDYGSHDSVSF